MKTKPASLSVFLVLTVFFLALLCFNPSFTLAQQGTDTLKGATCEWSAGPDMPSVGTRSVGVYFPANGKFYEMGGRSSDSSGSDFRRPFEYDPATNAWTTKSATYPDAEVNNMACGVLTESGTPYIYCVGGSQAGNTTATARVFRYNPVTDTINSLTAADNWPGDLAGTILPGGFAVAGNDLYILGGFSINIASTNEIWQFDPSAAAGAKWTQKVNTPVAIMYAPTCSINGIIYVGGASDWDAGSGTVIDTTNSFSFNPAANSVGTIAAIPRATGETRALNFNGQMLVMGGGRVAPNPSNEVDVYDPGSNSWSTSVPPFNIPRRNFATDTDGTGRIWLAGGYDSSGTVLLSSMEILDCGGGGALELTSAQSFIGSSPFGINLPLSGPSGVEDRSGGPTGRYKIVMVFNNNITSLTGATSSCGAILSATISAADAHRVNVVLSAKRSCIASDIIVTADGISDDQGNFLPSASVTMGLLVGDVDGDRTVTTNDVRAIKADRGMATDSSNFREDINGDGHIESGDVKIAAGQVGRSLP
jgi:Kelch motif